MTTIEIRAQLEKVEKSIFYEQMADFMDWKAYYRLKAQRDELRKQLKELEG